MTIGIVGLGLIGGSVAKALKRSGKHRIIGADKNADVVRSALAEGVIDSDESIEDCDVVYVCLPPIDTTKYLLSHKFKPGAVLTDVSGVKRFIVDKVAKPLREAGYCFVGGHPMAGKECSGYQNSDADLFKGADYILIKDAEADPKGFTILQNLALDMGFSHITRASAAEHDKIIAYTSQLAHIVSNAYVKNPLSLEEGFSAGSFEDMTRVAKMDYALWAELFVENADYICSEIDALIKNLEELKGVISLKNTRQLRSVLKDGNDAREKVLEIREKRRRE